MKKEYLDLLYGLRGSILNEIPRLESDLKEPVFRCCENMPNYNKAENYLSIYREFLLAINKIIESYLEIHK